MLVIEDGTGVDGANSYVDVAFADAYFALYGGGSWDEATVEIKERALAVSSQYADARWAVAVGGLPLTCTQGLALPLKGVYGARGCEISGVPVKWQNAICEYAKESLTTQLYNTSADGSALVKKRVVVGPITTENQFSDPADRTKRQIPKPDMMVKELFSLGSGRVER